MTSSPGPTPARRKPISSVAVPELKVRTGRPPQYSESAASNAWFCGPVVIQPERSTSATPWIVSSSISGRTNGKNGTDDWLMNASLERNRATPKGATNRQGYFDRRDGVVRV